MFTKVVQIIVLVSALGGVLTFLGFRTAIRRTLRTLGRKPDQLPPPHQRSDVEVIRRERHEV